MDASTKLQTTPITESKDELAIFEKFTAPEHGAKKAGDGKDSLMFLVLLGVLVLSVINSIGLFSIYFLYSSFSNSSKSPTLVQLAGGKTITAATVDSHVRSADVIKKFVAVNTSSLMSWSVQLSADVTQGGSPILDAGIEVVSLRGSKKKVPTTAWQASFAFAEDFRKGILASVAELVPADVFTGNAKVVLVIKSIRPPEEIEKGKWKVSLVSNLITFTAVNQAGESVPFNKEIFIQTIDIPTLKPDASPLDEAIYKVRSSGLEIYAMRDLARENLK
ncbi:MAG: hypothetical protein ACKPCM_11790 [Pseudanabaena sp.]